MKRDDFNVRIDEVRELATKYSKPDLQRMVQMGIVDPQKAVMAGMMIDRIAKSAMQPPTSTVAQDVLGMAPTVAQGQIPQGQMPPQMPPQMPTMAADGGIMSALPYSDGVAALPANLPDYAGGGIVAFADGGDIPGYAEGTLTSSRNDPAMKINPAVQSKRDETRYQILAEELKDAQRRMMRGDPNAEGDFKAIQREMRSVKPARSADAGIGALIPSAEAATPMAARRAPVSAPEEDDAVYDPMTGVQISGSSRAKESPMATMTPAEIAAKVVDPGYQPYRPPAKAAVAPPPAAPIPPSKFEVREAPVTPPPPAPAEPELQRPQTIEAQKMTVPPEKSAKAEYAEVQDMYKEAGVNPNIYADRMRELEGEKGGLSKRRDQALGAALMAFGLDFMGAREGQVGQQLSSSGNKALGLYMNRMDKIVENEERIKALQNQARMEENNFKRTGAENALARRDRALARADNIMAKNAEFAQDAAKANANLIADVYKTDTYFKAQSQNAAARLAAALGANRGGYSEKQLGDLYAQVDMENRPRLQELYKDAADKDAKINEAIEKLAIERVNQVRGLRQKGNIPVPSSGGGQYNVEGM